MLISPLGENALTVSFGNIISEDLNRKAIALCRILEQAPFPGMIEAVPAYSSVTIFYELIVTRNAFLEYATAFEAISVLVEGMLQYVDISELDDPRMHKIPVHIGPEASLDLDSIAESRGVSPEDFLAIFLERTYRVFMIGFLPGFAYMGEVDGRIAVPRLTSPRTNVPKGSVGIAGNQAGIYPRNSPGGWQIIGRTDLQLFDAKRVEPCLFRAGDEVRFVRV